MNLIKLDLGAASGIEPENETLNGSVGIHELQAESNVVRTYSNGLSFKHVPGKERRPYKMAFSTRIRELGLQSAEKCHLHSPQIMGLFTRWSALKKHHLEREGLEGEWEGEEVLEELQSLARALNLPFEKMNADTLYRSLNNAFTYRDPKVLGAHLAAICQDRSNLGQSSFLRLVAAGRNYIDMTENLSWLKSLFAKEPKEFASFLLFGRAPWTEARLSRRFRSIFSWARNFLVGIHNKFTHSLTTNGVSLPGMILPTETELVEILEDFIKEIRKKIEEMEQKGKNTSHITSFFNSLTRIKQAHFHVSDWFLIVENTFSWHALKQHANTLRGISFSALRAVIIRACLHHVEWTHAIDRCIRLFTPDTTLKKPFHDRTQLQSLPIDLVMGQKFVIYRPGNASKMKDILLEDGCLWFEVPKVFLNESLKKANACWHAPKKVLRALEKGVRLRLFRFNMPRGPGKTIKVDVVLSGPEESFISAKHLNGVTSISSKGLATQVSVLGIDVNRLSEYVLTGSRDLEMDNALKKLLSKWYALELAISSLQARRNRCHDWKKALKLKTELQLAHQRRSRLRTDVLRRARIQLGKKVFEWNVSHVALEADIIKDTKDTRGALARAIISMPDNIVLIAQELLVVTLTFQKNIMLVLVRKEGTSRYHNGCGGIIDRMGDMGTCQTCKTVVNTHDNAADNIEERAIKLIEKYQNNQSHGSTPSASYPPRTQPSGHLNEKNV